MLRLSAYVLCVTVIALGTSDAHAQTKPAPATERAPDAMSVRGNDRANDRDNARGNERTNDRGQTVSPYWGETGDLPAADIRAVPSASAAAVEARWVFNQSMVDLANATRLLEKQIELQPEFSKALREEKESYEALSQIRRNAVGSLLENPAYTGAEQLRLNLSRQIVEEFEQEKPDQIRIDAMARLKLDYGRENRQLEQALLERDGSHADARNRYIEAASVVRDLRMRQSMVIATDESLSDIRRQIAGARITKLASAAYLRGMVQSRAMAVDYAKFYRAYDRRPYYAPYGYTSTYGRGYGSQN